MIDDSDYKPGYFNKIRHTHFIQIINECGFDVIDRACSIGLPTEDERKSFLPEYKSLNEEDIMTLEAKLLLKKA